MRAMLLHQTAPIESSPLRLVNFPEPTPGLGEVRVKVRCCAICRTDLHIIEGDLKEARRPVIPGHQIVGMVDEVGEECDRLKPGDRVGVAWLQHTCGRCRFCCAGRENLCDHSVYTGYHEHGGYAEYVVVPEAFAYRIPQAFTDFDASPLLCAGIIGYRSLQRSRLRDGGSLALYGFGSSAHVVLQIARHRGCEVYVVSRGERHRQLAARLGAAWVGRTAESLPAQVESAIIFAPAGELVPAALDRLDKGGTLALAGIHMSEIPSLNYDASLFYERDIHPVTANTRSDGCELLEEAAQIPIRPQITTYPLKDANRALQDLKADRINGTGVLVVE